MLNFCFRIAMALLILINCWIWYGRWRDRGLCQRETSVVWKVPGFRYEHQTFVYFGDARCEDRRNHDGAT